ncbi:hypothetical protein [Micromonospora craniellae]|uniref:Uncharacterized protein n=1 Tax=Micromonospora craniellae TaxID=2294034 RepID=A0A372G3I4_9ACTN|nr:hypothetical protein [Micromonospora craniellae]QOC91973.1 hypothetical protein ID554_29560 [Micromonospora craniellae]RFS47563.1 hypothetical protein D0Q02_06210 [Micromonospora craniellae]
MAIINRLGDKMLAALLPKAKASACNVCTRAYVGCGGPFCYYYNKVVSGQVCCYANTADYCSAPSVSYTTGCC